ncbi:MAG: ABC-F family ATP-binding cassette domain-containing protein [Bdellovibrio sp.]|nr:ABC-F family ATP-binding cassette domain-containing protein [Bdellovibrio sp.]
MATLISAHLISKTFATKTLFQNISFAIDESEHIGLIGPNGAGKSTLLSLIAREQAPDSGKLSFSNGLRLGYLKQKPTFEGDDTIYMALMSACDDPYDSENIALAYELIARFKLDQFPDAEHKLTSELSGGWQKKLALARELMKRPTLLLLDEPTNHLDLESILWLEDYMNKEKRIAFLTVTHDRRFLQNTSSAIFDLDPRLPNGILRTNGAYADHLDSKMQLLQGLKRLEEKRRNTMQIEKDWLSRGPQARLTKQKARIDRAHDIIEEVSDLENKNRANKLNLDFGKTDSSPKKLIAAENIKKSYGDRVLFQNFNAMISPGHRYGLIGTNGCGKSTLLKCLIGKAQVDSGIAFLNEDISVCYFEQGKDSLNPDVSVIKTICPEGDYVHLQGLPVFAKSYLSRFYFRSEQHDMPVGKLSGGEQSRLILAKLMLQSSHVLILDEPTNDLDVETLDALSDTLSDYRGAIIIVSHDRYFMDQNCNVIWSFGDADGHIQKFADTFQWEEWHQQNKLIKPNAKQAAKAEVAKAAPKVKLSNKEKFELDNMEKNIADEESLLASLQKDLTNASPSDYSKLSDLTAKISQSESKLEKLFARWSELTQKTT